METALAAAGANSDLERLQNDLKELIQLTEGTIKFLYMYARMSNGS